LARPEHTSRRTAVNNDNRGADHDDSSTSADPHSTNGNFRCARHCSTHHDRGSSLDRCWPNNSCPPNGRRCNDNRSAGHHGDDGGAHHHAGTHDDGCTDDHGRDDIVDDVDHPSSGHRRELS
jgi:hypothetical protein